MDIERKQRNHKTKKRQRVTAAERGQRKAKANYRRSRQIQDWCEYDD